MKNIYIACTHQNSILNKNNSFVFFSPCSKGFPSLLAMPRREEEALSVQSVEPETRNENDGEEKKKKWKEGERDFLMVATTFIAAMAFQAGINPPGGVWQDDNNPKYEAGKSIMASKSPSNFVSFMGGVTVCLACSTMQFIVLLLKLPYKSWSVTRSFLYFTMGSAVSSMVVAYWSSVKALTPDSQMSSVITMLRTSLGISVVLLPISMYLEKKLSS